MGGNINKMKNIAYHSIRTVPKSYKIIIETEVN
jgi:hypothetical protein